ncbi:hypothetical protein AKJ65_03665 [candidate division MSBL1 archaeon SCGC-AAA259E19]|uniref:Sulfatase N-terminal domain-containing protein n=1 Tax=candidate division MSBL1 archaeon SCGC-AAA259E19 TaxID=1698264 RepID=A0A133UKP4_9EURY|nr:hypothetical protein AKJ65_03665 [candidate division MSBL1 archaeon SCGC-AAA259E19]
MEKRNIVLITLDSVRADHCSHLGYERKTTPTIDKMAKNGLCFENAIASGVPTLPSMFGIFTGDFALNNAGVFMGKGQGREWRKSISNKKTLAETLSEMGYETRAYTDNPFSKEYFGLNKGFDYLYDSSKSSDSDGFSLDPFQIGDDTPFAGREFFRDKGGFLSKIKSLWSAVGTLVKEERKVKPWEKLYPDIIKGIEEAEEPYFIWILLIDTHLPYVPKIKKWRSNQILNLYLSYKIMREGERSIRFNRKDRKRIIDAYDDTILYSDMFIGKLWKDLRDDDPIFIVHADHGEGFGEHGYYGHPTELYEELVHVPLVVFNAEAKGKVKKPFSLKDLSSIILLETINIDNFPGKTPFEKDSDWVISKVFERNKRKIAVRMKDWKFISKEDGVDKLYNLANDPEEQKNLVNKHPELEKLIKRIVSLSEKKESEKKRLRDKISKIRG